MPITADHTETVEIAGKLRDALQNLHNMCDTAGTASTVKELSSNRRENLLAVYTKKYKLDGVSMAEAQMLARNDPEYQELFEQQAKQLESANQVDKRWRSGERLIDGARSLLAASRVINDNLMG